MSRSNRFHLAFLLSFLVSCLHALPQHRHAADRPALSVFARQTPPVRECRILGNADIYGLGIRLGYYFQIFSSWLANYFVLHESKALRPINTLFMFAMFLALVWISHTPDEVYAIEAFLLLQLLLVTWFVGVKERSRWSAKYWQYDPVRSIIRETSVIGILTCNVWFWWYGLNAFQKSDCTTYAFFLAKVDLYGWFRSAHKVLSIVALVFQTVQALGDMLQLANHWRTRKIRRPGYFGELAERLVQESVLLHESERQVSEPSVAYDSPSELKGKVVYHDSACSPIIGIDQKRPVIPYYDASSNHFDGYIQPAKPPSDVQVAVDHMETRTSTELTRFSANSSAQHSRVNRIPSQETPTTTTFDALHAADQYLTYVLEPPSKAPTHSYRIPNTPITIHLPSLLCPTPRLSPRAIITNLPILLPLFTHIYSLRTYPFPTYPSLLHRATTSPYTQNPTASTTSTPPTLTPTILSTFLLLHTTTLPPTNRKLFLLPSALAMLSFVIGLVLAIELCIVWNGISQVGDMATVGQLVPFVLGVGGLLKVGFSWVRGWWAKDEGGREARGEGNGEGEVERCAQVYYRMKAEKEARDNGLG